MFTTHQLPLVEPDEREGDRRCECVHACDDPGCASPDLDHRCPEPALWRVTTGCVEPGCACAAGVELLCETCTIVREEDLGPHLVTRRPL